MYLFFDISSTQSCSFYFSLYLSPLRLNCFIASLFLLMPFPHSLPMYLSQTSLAIYLLLSVSLLFCYCFSISPSLTHSQSLWRNLWPYFTLSLRHYSSPFSIPIMLWLSLILICFVSIIIIFLLVLSLAYMKMNILEKSLISISHDFLYFSSFLLF